VPCGAEIWKYLDAGVLQGREDRTGDQYVFRARLSVVPHQSLAALDLFDYIGGVTVDEAIRDALAFAIVDPAGVEARGAVVDGEHD
jgi:hypothetical protein